MHIYATLKPTMGYVNIDSPQASAAFDLAFSLVRNFTNLESYLNFELLNSKISPEVSECSDLNLGASSLTTIPKGLIALPSIQPPEESSIEQV